MLGAVAPQSVPSGTASDSGPGDEPGSSPGKRAWRPRAARETVVVLFFAGLSVLATRPLARDLGNSTLYGADPAIYVWMVNWLSGHLLQPSQLFGGNLFHPTPHAALLSDLAFGTALFAAPLRPVLRDPVLLYNVGLLLTLTFGAWAFYTLVRESTGSTAAGLLSGTLAAYGSHQLHHLYQLGLVNIGWLALFLLALRRTFARPSPVNAMALGLTFALNTLSSAYFAVAAAVMALVWALVHWRAARSAALVRAHVGAVALSAVLLAPYASAFLWLQETEGVRRSVEVNVDNAFKPSRDLTSATYLYRGLLGEEGERLFPGILTLALAAWACLRRVAGLSFHAWSVLVLTVLSLGPQVQVGGGTLRLPYAAVFAVPPFDALMHPYSFAAVARFVLCILAGLGFATLVPRGRSWPVPAAAALALAEVASPGAGVRKVPPGVPDVYRALESVPPGPVLEVPLESPDALIWAARHGRPVLNGASALAPVGHDRLQQWIRKDWVRPSREGHVPDVDRTRAMRQLLRMPARYVIVRAGAHPELVGLAKGFARSRHFARVDTGGGPDRLYRRNDDGRP